MLLTQIVHTVPVSADQLYAHWSDPRTWTRWRTDLEWVDMPTPVTTGSRGQVMGKKAQRATAVRVVEMDPGRHVFVDATPLTLARLEVRYEARPLGGDGTIGPTEVTVGYRVEGLMKNGWSRLLRRSADADGLRADLRRLLELIEAESPAGPASPAS